MIIEKNIPFGVSDISKTGQMMKLLPKLCVGDSFLIDCSKGGYESSLWRAAIDYTVKKLNLKIKLRLKKQNENEYRVWRTK
jgi:hypothetical protein